ncbi:putative Peptide chain release factor [Hibiscus syriacus]|uniref:Pectinesterase n=1 Tax=Hibiscus syriacus TaxID=106335 RepID=A0A6A3AG74_HIBSY|nr:putative Peptide chain release factor [Hibiscus syriacus]
MLITKILAKRPSVSADPKDFVCQSILAAEEAVVKFFSYSDSLIDAVTTIAGRGWRWTIGMGDRISDLRTWLSAVISYQQSCLDGFEEEDNMKEGITDASELTPNALAIVTKLSEIFSKFGIQLNLHAFQSRRLLSIEKDVYPSWFSDVDRKLFAKIDNSNIELNAVVAKDGSTEFRTIAEALAAAPKQSQVRHVIYVKAGIYDEYITVDKKTTKILMYGDGPRQTIVTGGKNFVDGIQTWKTATFSAIGDGFVARSMGFRNSAGPEKHQAVALHIQSDKPAFFNCLI